jgi:hypothetical protein
MYQNDRGIGRSHHLGVGCRNVYGSCKECNKPEMDALKICLPALMCSVSLHLRLPTVYGFQALFLSRVHNSPVERTCLSCTETAGFSYSLEEHEIERTPPNKLLAWASLVFQASKAQRRGAVRHWWEPPGFCGHTLA